MVELAKEQEARTAASMGYNPYEARLMGNTVSDVGGRDWGQYNVVHRSCFPTFSAGVCTEGRATR